MRKFCVTAALCAALTLIAPSGALAGSLPGATDQKTAPQRNNPVADNAKQQRTRPPPHKGVIAPPPTGDEGIFTNAPNPDAGHEREVIPPPDTPPAHGSAIQRLL
jgi:hypothetical protein